MKISARLWLPVPAALVELLDGLQRGGQAAALDHVIVRLHPRVLLVRDIPPSDTTAAA